jgi:SAM-dependent methyltransferase
VLDLGAGVGRIADPLAALGHRVTAVDDSIDMLTHVARAVTVCSRIENLCLPDRFDAVLLATNLINYPGDELRNRILATVRRHLKPAGKGIIQWVPPAWFASRPPGTYHRTDAKLVQAMTIRSNHDGLAEGVFTLQADGQTWRQPLRFVHLSGEQLRNQLNNAGLELDTATPDDAAWLTVCRRR